MHEASVTPEGPSPGPPPEPSIRFPALVTGALLVLWAVVTIGAPWIAGPIAAQVERVEVALGFDVLPGHANKDDDP